MAAKDIMIGSHSIAPALCAGDEFESAPAIKNELGPVYQAGFEAGYVFGREAGLKEAREAAVAQLCAARHDAEAHQVPKPRVAPERSVARGVVGYDEQGAPFQRARKLRAGVVLERQ